MLLGLSVREDQAYPGLAAPSRRLETVVAPQGSRTTQFLALLSGWSGSLGF